MKKSLAILYGQAPEFSTSFQTRELARHLETWFSVKHFEFPAGAGRFKRQALRLAQRFFSPAYRADSDFLLYGNDGLADLRRAKSKTVLYWYDAPADWSINPPSSYKDRIRLKNVRGADHVFAVSAAQVRVAKTLRPGREDSVHYLPVGVDCNFFDPAKIDRTAARTRFGLKNDDIVIGYLGYLGKFQNRFAGEALLEAVPLLREPRARFLIVGSGPALDDWRNVTRSLGVENRFVFTGFIPTADLPAALVAMDICVDTLEPGFHSEARSETKLKQYMAMGRACVATEIGENRVDLDAGRTGLLAAPNASALARAIDSLASSCERRSALGALARERALSTYDWSKLAARMASALIQH